MPNAAGASISGCRPFLIGAAALLFHLIRIADPLDIHVGLDLFFGMILAVWLGRKLSRLASPTWRDAPMKTLKGA
jgi:hypothetical protein